MPCSRRSPSVGADCCSPFMASPRGCSSSTYRVTEPVLDKLEAALSSIGAALGFQSGFLMVGGMNCGGKGRRKSEHFRTGQTKNKRDAHAERDSERKKKPQRGKAGKIAILPTVNTKPATPAPTGKLCMVIPG